jgi:hypothetical protein
MRRALLTTALLAAALPATAGAAPLPASARLVSCSVEDHEAVFYGRMKQVPGTARMAMRFTLLEDTGGEAQRVKAPGLNRWRSSKPGVRSFGYRQGFRNLPENATHRVRVQFRWYSATGEEIGRTRRTSPPCRQFVELPNLVVELTRVVPTKLTAVMRYEALVINTGGGAATSVPVRLTVDGKVVDTVTVASLEPGEERSVAIRGPDCHRLAKLEVDPDLVIAESSDADNVYERSCAALRNTG